jgi:hypothetical protein
MALLLMTATVTPPPAATNLARTDPVERLADYAVALQFYVRQLEQGVFDGIVFVDNSASDIASLRALAAASPRRAAIELISYAGLDYPPEHGRAYGEMRLIEHAMAASHLITAAAPEDFVWKATGRYVIENVAELVVGTAGAELVCHCRSLPRPWVDMYLMGWRKDAYDAVLGGAAEEIKDGPAGGSEVAFRHWVDAKARAHRIVRRFRWPPEVRGTRGYDNRRYEEQHLKVWSRRALAVVAPWVWI